MEIHPTKKLIFDVIADLLDEQGIAGVTFSNISQRAFLQKSSIAYYFKGRQDMINQYYCYFLWNNKSFTPIELQNPTADNAVNLFCKIIDELLGEYEFTQGEDSLYRHMLISSLYNDEAKDLVLQKVKDSEELLFDLLKPYIKLGIIEEGRIQLAMAEMAVYSSFSSFIKLFDLAISDYDLALKVTIERVKRAFLKDGLYPPKVKD